jgi:hypothetical protein
MLPLNVVSTRQVAARCKARTVLDISEHWDREFEGACMYLCMYVCMQACVRFSSTRVRIAVRWIDP